MTYRGVAVPDVEPGTSQRLTGADTNELSLHDDLNPCLIIAHIFALNVEWSYFYFRVENDAGSAVENVRLIGQSLVHVKITLVVLVQNAGSVSLDSILPAVGAWGIMMSVSARYGSGFILVL
jgi:hypothetical protein